VRTLALDYGEARIGVAISDPTGVVAQPLETIATQRGDAAALARIAEIVKTRDVGQIVVGLPLHMSGRRGPEVERAQAFGERVRARTGVAVEYLDERWTSREAERTLDDAGVSRRKQRGRIDPIAAALLLRTWLELHRA
jgi:putative Holliday junction resolvase